VLGLRQTINFSNEKLISEINAPMGQITMQIEDGEGKMMMGGNEMPMQPAQKEQVLAELYRNHIFLALNRNNLDVDFMGMEQIDGTEYAHLRINDEITLNLYLDPESNLPMITRYRQFDPQAGGNVDVKMVSSDWREGSGVMMPYEMTGYADGERQSKTVIKSHSIE